MNKRLLRVAKEHAVTDQVRDFTSVADRLLALDSLMQVNVNRHPLQMITLDQWRKEVRDVAQVAAVGSTKLQKFTKALAREIKEG